MLYSRLHFWLGGFRPMEKQFCPSLAARGGIIADIIGAPGDKRITVLTNRYTLQIYLDENLKSQSGTRRLDLGDDIWIEDLHGIYPIQTHIVDREQESRRVNHQNCRVSGTLWINSSAFWDQLEDFPMRHFESNIVLQGYHSYEFY